MEKWKKIPGFEGYEVSDMGRVRSLKLGKVKIMKQSEDAKGYFRLSLYNNSQSKVHYVASLVAMAFLGHKPCGHKIVVDHIDENPKNNRLENLQLITQRENCCRVQKGRYSSDFKGVYWRKDVSKWAAKITVYEKQKHLGYFNKEKEAAEAYQRALKEIES